jgi:ribosomal-protein-alanine N-acetyltransferase
LEWIDIRSSIRSSIDVPNPVMSSECGWEEGASKVAEEGAPTVKKLGLAGVRPFAVAGRVNLCTFAIGARVMALPATHGPAQAPPRGLTVLVEARTIPSRLRIARRPMPALETPRLTLVPMTLALVEAVLGGRREEAEAVVGARMPDRWPNRELIERAFSAPLEAIRADPEEGLWGGRVLVTRAAIAPDLGGGDSARHRSAASADGPRVVGSVVFHGRPGSDGIAEVAYGVEEASQGRGFATEAVKACVAWALAERDVRAVQAATFGWHTASLRVIAKVGMVHVGSREHETLGELLVFERRR